MIQYELETEAIHVGELGMQCSADEEVWDFASKQSFTLISKDADFVNQFIYSPTATLIWVRLGNCRSRYLLDVFRRAWPRIVERLESGDRFIEVR